jgi:hypothetical protein
MTERTPEEIKAGIEQAREALARGAGAVAEYLQVDACICCVRGTFTDPYGNGDGSLCFDCKHPEDLHGEYDGPWGSQYEWTS